MFKNKVLLIFFCLFTYITNGQTFGDSTIKNDIEIFYTVENPPEFPGGIKGLYNFIADNLNKPTDVSSNILRKYIILKIIINKEGKVVFAEVEKGINYNYNKKAIDLIKKMPVWLPAKQNGKPVYFYQFIPIVFVDG